MSAAIIIECQRLCGWTQNAKMMPPRKPTLPEVYAVIAAYYALPGNGAGGELHVVLDDSNYERRFIRQCKARTSSAATGWLCAVLLLLSNSQRRKMGRRDRSKGTDAVVTDGGAGSTPAARHP